MHHSRLGQINFDTKTDHLDSAAEFWSAALGRPCQQPKTDDAGRYVPLTMRPDEIAVEIQRVEHPSRVHIDIETDDIAAEVERLEALGAKRIAHVRTWWVMEAPTGHKFCVVHPRNDDFPAGANRWE